MFSVSDHLCLLLSFQVFTLTFFDNSFEYSELLLDYCLLHILHLSPVVLLSSYLNQVVLDQTQILTQNMTTSL